MQEAYINKVEYFLPTKKEFNSNILKIAGKKKEDINKWISKIGIKSRRIASKNVFANDLALTSAKKVLKNGSLSSNHICSLGCTLFVLRSSRLASYQFNELLSTFFA